MVEAIFPADSLSPEKLIEGVNKELVDKDKIHWLRRDRYESEDKDKWRFIVQCSASFEGKKHLVCSSHDDLDVVLRVVESQLCTAAHAGLEGSEVKIIIEKRSEKKMKGNKK